MTMNKSSPRDIWQLLPSLLQGINSINENPRIRRCPDDQVTTKDDATGLEGQPLFRWLPWYKNGWGPRPRPRRYFYKKLVDD